jgi:hypothetical protein
MSEAPISRRALLAAVRPWVASAAVLLALALAVRFLAIEPRGIGIACLGQPMPWWCGPRDIVVAISSGGGWGVASLGFGLLALITGWRPLAVLACGLGLWGVVLYNAGAAAFGLLFGLLRLVRADTGITGPQPQGPQGRQQR